MFSPSSFARIIRHLRRYVVLAYAIFLIGLITVYFFNYGGRWLHTVAEKFPLTY